MHTDLSPQLHSDGCNELIQQLAVCHSEVNIHCEIMQWLKLHNGQQWGNEAIGLNITFSCVFFLAMFFCLGDANCDSNNFVSEPAKPQRQV